MAPIPPVAAFCFKPCLPGPLADELLSEMRAYISSVKIPIPERDPIRAIPELHMRGVCVGGVHLFGLWLEPPAAAVVDNYEEGLADLDLLEGSESFGVYISKTLINSVANRAWARWPKRYTRNNPNPADDGRVHLNGYEISLLEPNKWVTKVTGTVDVSWWDNGDLTVTLTDTLSASAGILRCVTDADVAVDVGWAPDPDIDANTLGASCHLVNEIPSKLELKDGKYVTFQFSRIEVKTDYQWIIFARKSIVAGGTHQIHGA